MRASHYSPSQFNSFLNYRHQWIGNKILGNTFRNNASFARGKAVETGIAAYLCRGKTPEEAIEMAKKDYVIQSDDLEGEEKDVHKDQIEPMVKAGIKFYQSISPYMKGEVKEQTKIRTKLDDSGTEVIGYLDLEWENEIRDIKTATRTPSALSEGYVIQGAIYRHATGKPVTFDFIVPLKTGVKMKSISLTDENYAHGMLLANVAARQMDIIMETVPDVLTPDHIKVYKALALTAPSAVWNKTERGEIITGLANYNL